MNAYDSVYPYNRMSVKEILGILLKDVQTLLFLTELCIILIPTNLYTTMPLILLMTFYNA